MTHKATFTFPSLCVAINTAPSPAIGVCSESSVLLHRLLALAVVIKEKYIFVTEEVVEPQRT